MHLIHVWDKVSEVRTDHNRLASKIYLFKRCRKCKKIKPLEYLEITKERIIFGDKNEIHERS